MLGMAEARAPRYFFSPCSPLRALQPALLLTMRESITAMRFQGHCQQWSEPRARMNAGVSPAMRRDAAVSMPVAQPAPRPAPPARRGDRRARPGTSAYRRWRRPLIPGAPIEQASCLALADSPPLL